jgi:hypothetical protein
MQALDNPPAPGSKLRSLPGRVPAWSNQKARRNIHNRDCPSIINNDADIEWIDIND